MPTLAILTAAGSGTRLGLDIPKALVELGGLPLVVHAARRLVASGAVDALVVTAPDGFVEHVESVLSADIAIHVPVRVVAGSLTRQASVAAGLAVASPDTDVVLVHDAARPLAPPALVRRVVAAVKAGRSAVVPGLPVTDTVKEVGVVASGEVERVTATLARTRLRAIQTPQGFDRALLDRAHAAAADRAADDATAATDDAGLVEELGMDVYVVPGDGRAAKITTAHDLRVAEVTLAEER